MDDASEISEPRFDTQEFVFAAVVAERKCGFEDCTAQPSWTCSMVRRISSGSVAYETLWSCHEDVAYLLRFQDEQMDDGSIVTSWIQELLPTCLVAGCDALATHAVFVARDYGPTARRMEAMSLCGKHAGQIERDLPPIKDSRSDSS